MTTRNWIIAAAVVVVLIIAAYFVLRPTRETPAGTMAPPATTEEAPPATTEQPAQPAPSN